MKPTRRVGSHGLAVHEHPAAADATDLPVILIHGTMDRATSLAKVARRLPDLHVIRYDRRGYGDSLLGPGDTPVPPADTVEAQVADLLDVVDRTRCIVVGHSMGGTVALAAAARRPDLIAAVAAYESPRPWVPWWPTTSPGARVADDAELDPATAAERFMRRMIGDAQWDRMPASSREKRRAEGPALIADMVAIRSAPAYRDADLTMPVVSARGGESTDHHSRAAEEIAASVPNGELWVIDGARHGAHLTHPDEFAAMVRHTVALARS